MQQPNAPKRPPRSQVIFALSMVALMFASAYVGINYEYILGVYVKGTAVFLTVGSFLAALYFPFKSIDDHRRDNPDDPDGGLG